MPTRSLILLPVFAIALGAAATAGSLGQPAGKLAIDFWIKGEPIDVGPAQQGRVLLIEFWATWRTHDEWTGPLLSRLQDKYPDELVVVGISNEDDKVAEVERFVRERDKQMDYTIAIDRDNQTTEAYRGAFKISGMPHSFIVDRKGRVVWEGRTLRRPYELQRALEQVIEGTYDLEAAKRRERAVRMMVGFYQLCLERGNERAADHIGKRIVELLRDHPATASDFGYGIMTKPYLQYRSMPTALAATRSAYENSDEPDARILANYARALFEQGRPHRAVELQRRALALRTPITTQPAKPQPIRGGLITPDRPSYDREALLEDLRRYEQAAEKAPPATRPAGTQADDD